MTERPHRREDDGGAKSSGSVADLTEQFVWLGRLGWYRHVMGIRIDGATGENVTSCTSCGEVIYPDLRALVNHDVVVLPDGRTRLYSFDFERTVHLCSLDAIAAQAESVIVEATSLLA